MYNEGLAGRRLMVVEDEFIVAMDLASRLEDLGAEIVGPAGTVEDALALVETQGGRLDGSVLDINLHGARVYPVADRLAALGLPFVFTTGYDALVLPPAYAGMPRFEKPIDVAALAQLLAADTAPSR
jgi:CheY-like chemotaxis protein